MRRTAASGMAILAAATVGCIAPMNYHPGASSTVTIDFKAQKGYFVPARVYESYIELDEHGKQYPAQGKTQLTSALDLINALRHPSPGEDRRILLVLFVHGWKNNASESSGNVWGFRRVLDHIAGNIYPTGTPVLGVYVGWPGLSTNVGTDLSFWGRQLVADAVGKGDLPTILEQLLIATRGEHFDGVSDAVLVGHSFGGLVLEEAVIPLLEKHLSTAGPGVSVEPPANLIVLLNEAGPASHAKPFLDTLRQDAVVYQDAAGKDYPLLLSLTSTGDLATKLAFPGGEVLLAPKGEDIKPPDHFGQNRTTPYNLLTAANFVALQSHEIVATPPAPGGPVELTVGVDGKCWAVAQKPATQRLNQTPYWISQLPQVFAPDHSTIFRDEVIALLGAFLADRGLMSAEALPSGRSPCAAPAPAVRAPRKLALRKKARA